MDHAWAAGQLQHFRGLIDTLERQEHEFNVQTARTVGEVNDQLGSFRDVTDRLVSLDPVMRELMEAARPGLGEYTEPPTGGWSFGDSKYWHEVVRDRVLRAIGIHELGAEARRRMRPDSPDLVADQFHPWVWEAAAPLWYAGSRQEAVHAAARSVNARLQQKLGRRDVSESSLCREAFSLDAPASGRPRLRFAGDRSSDTWCSRQQGGMQFGAGCFAGIRNPAAHEDHLELGEQIALEQLAAFSLLARWIDECTVETVAVSVPVQTV
jgi:hypothetical protein